MQSPGEFLSREFVKVKYTHRHSTQHLPELLWVLGPIESTESIEPTETSRLQFVADASCRKTCEGVMTVFV